MRIQLIWWCPSALFRQSLDNRDSALKPFLYEERNGISQAEIGQRFGVSESAVKSAVHRLPASYRDRLREAVADTVANPSEIDDELRHLLAVLSS